LGPKGPESKRGSPPVPLMAGLVTAIHVLLSQVLQKRRGCPA
jgi:hypothetical protein